MDSKQNETLSTHKFYVCSAGEPGKGYDEENLRRCETYNAHFMDKDTQRKGAFYNITLPAIAILKFQNVLVAYGEITKVWVDDGNEELCGWTCRVDVKEWIWKDPNNHKRGVSKDGIGDQTIEGSQFATIKQIDKKWGLGKIIEINPNTDLVRRVESELKQIQDMEKVKEYAALLENNHNLILTGAPGTGKTFLAKQIAATMILDRDYNEEVEQDPIFNEHCNFVQFHPSYDYTDFVEGLRPINKDGNVGFERQDGIFKQFCKEAKNNEKKKYVFIIDEINRGDISKIFGELFFSIDPGYRGKEGTVKTQYQNLVDEHDDFGEGFYVPKNVYIIGTMNDIDRSVESMDFAMRRRFVWKEIVAKDNVSMLNKLGPDEKEAIKRMNRLNAAIENTAGLSTAYHIGASYFLKLDLYRDKDHPDNPVKWAALWDNHIKGVLYEYLRGNEDVEEAMKTLEAAYKLEGE